MLARAHLDHNRRRQFMRKLRKMLNHPPCEIMVTIPGKITDPFPSTSLSTANASSLAFPSISSSTSAFTSCSDIGQLYDRSNRVEALTRLAQLQDARSGRWEYCSELADLVQRWRRGHSEELGATMGGDEVTLVVSLVMADLCRAVWMFRDRGEGGGGGETMQDQQQQNQMMGLKPSELVALRSANREWILGALDRANTLSSEQADEDFQAGRLIMT